MNKVLTFTNLQKVQVIETAIILAATMLVPFLVHLFPAINGNPAGMVFLPIFIAPLVAVFFFRTHVALVAGLLAPVLNYLLLGHPAPQMVLVLSTEIVAFVLIVNWLKNKSLVKYIVAPMAFVVAAFCAAIVTGLLGIVASPVSFWTNAIMVGFPGIILLGGINLALLKIRK